MSLGRVEEEGGMEGESDKGGGGGLSREICGADEGMGGALLSLSLSPSPPTYRPQWALAALPLPLRCMTMPALDDSGFLSANSAQVQAACPVWKLYRDLLLLFELNLAVRRAGMSLLKMHDLDAADLLYSVSMTQLDTLMYSARAVAARVALKFRSRKHELLSVPLLLCLTDLRNWSQYQTTTMHLALVINPLVNARQY
jgi:hypothetical protein